MKIHQDKGYYQTNENFIYRKIAGENLLIPVDEAGILNNTMISLNSTCLSLWKYYETPHTVQETIEEMLHLYSGKPEEIAKDIRQFTSEALDCGLLKEVD